MKIEMTLNEMKYTVLRALNLEANYRKDADAIGSPHTIEVIDGRAKLEESPR